MGFVAGFLTGAAAVVALIAAGYWLLVTMLGWRGQKPR